MASRVSKNRQRADGVAVGRTNGSESARAKADRPERAGSIHFAHGDLFCAGLVFLIALALYSWTLAPTVTLVDSGELIVVARSLGVAHPPGFPLWIMLAHLASLVPLGSVASRVNFSSALFAALAAAMLTLVVAELMIIASHLTKPKGGQERKKSQRSRRLVGAAVGEEAGRESAPGRLGVLAPALGTGLLMVFSRTLWSYATVAEVYALNTLLILLIVFLMLRWRRRIIADRKRVGPEPLITAHDGFLYAAAVIFGLALGVHHVTVALTLPALGIIVYRTAGLTFFTSKRLLSAAIFSLAALLAVYIYLPLAASHAPIINWGNPWSFQEIWWHITGRQYQVFFSFTPRMMGQQVLEFGRMALREFGLPWAPLTLVLALAGFGTVFRQDRTSFWFLSLLISANLVYALGYDIAEDKDAYYLPAFVSIAIAAGFGLRWWIQLGLFKSWSATSAQIAAALLVLLPAAIAFAGNWPFDNRRNYFIAQDYVENLLAAIEPNGLLLTLDWQVASPMLYAQEVEERRRDVKVVDVNLLRRSWYFDYLRRAHPDLIERSREKVDLFVAELRQWERDPQLYANDQALTRKISLAFNEMIRSMVMNENRVAPVYVTSDLALAGAGERELAQWLNQTFQLVPQGLVFNLAGDPSFHDSPDVRLQTRGLADGSLRFEKDDVVNLKVLPVYATMLINRGRYLAAFNRHERARAVFKQALSIDSSLSLAWQGVEESTNKLRNP